MVIDVNGRRVAGVVTGLARFYRSKFGTTGGLIASGGCPR